MFVFVFVFAFVFLFVFVFVFMFTLLFLQTMTSNAKCCWCKNTHPDVVLFSCEFCSTSLSTKHTCAPCYHGATGCPSSGKHNDWACNTCMKDKNSHAYLKLAATNYYNYHKEKDAAALGVKTRASVRVINPPPDEDPPEEEESANNSPKKKKDPEEEESANKSPKKKKKTTKKKDPPEKEEEESANKLPKNKKANFPVADVPAHNKVH